MVYFILIELKTMTITMLCTPTVMLLLVANLQIVTSLQVYIKSNKVLISKSTTPLHSNSIQVDMADFLISTAFSIKPLFKVASKKARDSIINQGAEIGVDWYANVAKLESRKEELEVEFQKLRIPSMQYPDYFLKPFHAYDEGNMSWQAAVELESAALSVHATVYSTTTSGKRELRRDGDFMLRDNFHSKMKEMFLEANFTPTSIIDLGCSSGLSTLKLHDSFPSARVIGMDLSPYYLSVANLQLRTLCASALVEYQHGLAEDTGLARGEVDLVTMCLVAHELPTQALRDILAEAYRILSPGGAFALMDMNPNSASFKKFTGNAFAFAAFKSTEPWIQEYVKTDLERELESCGFKNIGVAENSPRHRTVVAYK